MHTGDYALSCSISPNFSLNKGSLGLSRRMASKKYKAGINGAYKLISSLIGVFQFSMRISAKKSGSPPDAFIK